MKKILVCTASAPALLAALPAVAQTAGTAPQPPGKPVVTMEVVVSRDNALAMLTEHFERLDADGDGFVTQAEAAAGDQAARQRRERGDSGKPGSRGGMPGFGSYMMARGDADRDGRMSLAEAQAMGLRYFHMADANRDGQISGDELRQMRQRMINERRSG